MSKMYKILGKRGRITIPYEIRERVGFSVNDVLSFTESEDGKSIVIKLEKICDDCNQNNDLKINSSQETVIDYLDNLSQDNQIKALIHLSVKWAEKQNIGGKSNE